MNPQLNYYLAQAHTADLIRQAQRQRVDRGARRPHRRPRPAIARIIDTVARARMTTIPTSHHPPSNACE